MSCICCANCWRSTCHNRCTRYIRMAVVRSITSHSKQARRHQHAHRQHMRKCKHNCRRIRRRKHLCGCRRHSSINISSCQCRRHNNSTYMHWDHCRRHHHRRPRRNTNQNHCRKITIHRRQHKVRVNVSSAPQRTVSRVTIASSNKMRVITVTVTVRANRISIHPAIVRCNKINSITRRVRSSDKNNDAFSSKTPSAHNNSRNNNNRRRIAANCMLARRQIAMAQPRRMNRTMPLAPTIIISSSSSKRRHQVVVASMLAPPAMAVLARLAAAVSWRMRSRGARLVAARQMVALAAARMAPVPAPAAMLTYTRISSEYFCARID